MCTPSPIKGGYIDDLLFIFDAIFILLNLLYFVCNAGQDDLLVF